MFFFFFFYVAPLYIISCFQTSHNIRGPNNCIAGKKKRSKEPICYSRNHHIFNNNHFSNMSFITQSVIQSEACCQKRRKKIIIGVFIFSIISSHNLCQQNQNAFLSPVRKKVQLWCLNAVAFEIGWAG